MKNFLKRNFKGNSKRHKNLIRKNNGFSLVELMVVVAIIGILASIAVPNFQRFQARARQSEAKTNLGSYFQAARATHVEYGFYPGNFPATGWQPEGSLNYDYATINHFTKRCGTNSLPPDNTSGCINVCGLTTYGLFGPLSSPCNTSTYNYVTWIDKVPGQPSATTVGTLNFPTDTTYNMRACGHISGNPLVDCWMMDQSKNLVNIQSGI